MATIAENTAAKKQRETGATASTEVVLGAGALKLASATTSIQQALSALTQGATQVLDQLQGQAASLTLQIANGEEKVEQLKAEAKEAKRRNQVEIDLDFQADAAAAATKWATGSGKTIIDTRVYSAEQEAHDELVEKFEERVQKEVSTATQASAIKHQYELKAAQADYATKEAGNIATIANLQQQLAASQAESARAWAQLDAERKAGVERAQAASINTLNVGNPQR